jgi:hypothetical protein
MVYNAFFSDLPEFDKGDAHLDVIFKNGKFLDAKSKKKIQLSYDSNLFPDGIHVKLLAPLFALDKESQKSHCAEKKAVLLPKESILSFKIEDLTFNCQLVNDLVLNQKGNRIPFLSRCQCQIIKAMDWRGNPLSSIQLKFYDSLNQAYSGTSIDFFPDKKYHTGNVFKKFSTQDGYQLDNLRSKIEVEIFNKS